MKTIKTILLTVILGIALGSCGKDDSIDIEPNSSLEEQAEEQEKPKEEDSESQETEPVISIESIFPLEGPKETSVTITGKYFETDRSKVKVFFNGKEAEIQNLTDTEIIAIVPIKAMTGNVTVQVEDKTPIVGPIFKYELTTMVSTYIGQEAYMNTPMGITIDSSGTMYIADTFNHRVLIKDPDNAIKTFAGSTEGTDGGTVDEVKFSYPGDVIADDKGNIYVADTGNNRIRKIDSEGIVSSLAGSREGDEDGPGLRARFNRPTRMVLDSIGNMYVSDSHNHKIRKITPSRRVRTLAGSTVGTADGQGRNAQFYYPMGLTIDKEGTLYIADNENQRIRKITSEGMVTTVTGSTEGFENGTLETALFDYPSDLVVDSFGNLIIVDTGNHRIRLISPEGNVKTLAGSSFGNTDGAGAEAKFKNPYGICMDTQGAIYVSDTGNNSIRKIVYE